jgi:hypothetical protein
MMDKELRKMNRRQLLELLLVQTERADLLQKQLDEARRKLDERSIAIVESGSLAEAALKLSGIFEAAERAAEIYQENLRQRAEQGSHTEAEASARAQAMVEEAERKCRELERAADEYCAVAEERIRKQSELMAEIFGKGKA